MRDDRRAVGVEQGGCQHVEGLGATGARRVEAELNENFRIE